MKFLYTVYDFIFLIPEIYFFFCICFLLFFGVFYSNTNVFKYVVVIKPFVIFLFLFLFFYLCLLFNSICFGDTSIFSYIFLNDLSTIYLKIYLTILTFLLIFFGFNFFIFFEIFYFEFLILLIISCFSLILILMSFDFIVVYLCIELQSLCFYVLTAFNKHSNKSVEAALKYFILGSFSSCILLLGIAIIYGLTGFTNFKDLSFLLSIGFNSNILNKFFFLGFFLINVGFFFKLAVAPFHLWLPDVFFGASRFVVSVFAIIPKFVVLFLIYKIYLVIFIKFVLELEYFFIFFVLLCWFVGSIGAFSTRNINKILAYSSINHMGFFILAITFNDFIGLFLYIFIYTISMLNFFVMLFCLRKWNNNCELKTIDQLIYFKKSNYFISLALCMNLFSLAGIPPFIGFFGKFFIFLNLINFNLYILVFIGLIFSVVSSFYYLRIIKILNFNNVKNWIFLPNINKKTSFLVGFSFFFNLFFLFYLPFLLEFFNFLFLNLLFFL